jgi:3-deoxy-D-manno-octulosonic acid (KDO) 8-phosphate synthase
MQNDEAHPAQCPPGEGLSAAGRERLVELLAIGLERFFREGHPNTPSLTSSDDVCLYHDRADDDEADDA